MSPYLLLSGSLARIKGIFVTIELRGEISSRAFCLKSGEAGTLDGCPGREIIIERKILDFLSKIFFMSFNRINNPGDYR